MDDQIEEESKWDLQQDLYKIDLLNLFSYILNSAFEELKTTDSNKMVLIGLVKSLTNIIDKCEHTINRIPELKNLIKNRIVELVGQLLLTFDSKCLKNTCQLILTLFKRLRHLLKKELYILLDMIIINSLRSSTSEFYQKHYLLNLISNLLSQKDILVDIFTNYDCCPGYGNTLSKIFATLCICMSRSRDHEERVRA